jgi:serine/threonine-protein kinase HipA
MIQIKYCPSTLADGFDGYSPQAIRQLFKGRTVSPLLDFGMMNFAILAKSHAP